MLKDAYDSAVLKSTVGSLSGGAKVPIPQRPTKPTQPDAYQGLYYSETINDTRKVNQKPTGGGG